MAGSLKSNDLTKARLELPSDEYKASFIQAIKEFQSEPYPFNSGGMGRYQDVRAEELETNFGSFLEGLRDFSSGRNLKPGMVPQSTFWLIDNREFIGRASVRHFLNEKLTRVGGHVGYEIRPARRGCGYGKLILRLALRKAKDLGMDRVLITCDSMNAASRKIIEANGGAFETSFHRHRESRQGCDSGSSWLRRHCRSLTHCIRLDTVRS
jgi:predicted acetyltransferase